MYEGMKPKDAAKVFDRLEMPVLIEIASQIAPRKMSDILGLMSTEAAERLTVELARRAGSDQSASAADLPKIEGKMLPQKSNERGYLTSPRMALPAGCTLLLTVDIASERKPKRFYDDVMIPITSAII